ncbi:30S ribosomal protein S7 [bacterium]|nr:30S ribosomal protein S7 [bacterium]
MRGRAKFKTQTIQPDPKYHSELVAKFINYVMRKGKKAKAQSIVYSAFDIIQKKTKKKPLDVFEQALKNVGPYLEVKSRRVGGANYQVPMEVPKKRRTALAMRWILQVVRSRQGKPTKQKLAEELIFAAQGKGEAVRKKEEMHRMAEANKAFAHYAQR